ncbi:MAG: hypothetical protein K5919_08110 [Clostridiales bacterium]|nr:hypothetical protein [Clostridiales bacterium]
MKKLLSMLFVVCLMLSLVSAVLAEDYDYPTKDFFDDRIKGRVKYSGAENFDVDQFINSEYGEQTSLVLKTRYAYSEDMDEALLAQRKAEGIMKEGFNLDTEDKADNYYVYSPVDMEEGTLYPLLFVNHGGGAAAFTIEGFGFIDLIPTEKFIIASAEDTSVENLYAIYEAVTAKYPVDRTRVYSTGTSAGGMASVSIAVAYPKLIAAIAPNDIGPSMSTENAAVLKDAAMPISYTTGLADKYHPYPVASAEANAVATGISGYNNLLSAFGLEEYAMTEELSASLLSESESFIERATGLRFPNVEQLTYINNSVYRCEIVGANGATLRINVVENKPHMFIGYDARDAWNFLKQFSRDTETGELKVN